MAEVQKLYNRRGATLQGDRIRMPAKRSRIWEKAFDIVARETNRIAKENYSLGKTQLINDVLTTAYEQAPDNIKQFNELVESGFEKGLQGLDTRTQNLIKESANNKVKSLQLKVGQNLNNKLDAENSERVLNMANDTLYGLGGLYDLNQRISDAIISGDRETVDQLVELKNNAMKKYNTLAQAKNMRGKSILGKNALSGFQKENESGLYAAFQDQIFGMDVNELKNFDETTLQNRRGFLEKTGLSATTYDKLVKLVKSRGKELDENYKREVRSQNQLDLAMQFSDYNPEIMEKAKEFIPSDVYDVVKKSVEKAQSTPVNTSLRTTEDDNFNNQFALLYDVLMSKPDGSEDYNDRLLKSAAQVKNSLTRYRQLEGSNEGLGTVIDNFLMESLVNKTFGDVIRPSFEKGTALYELIESSPYYQRQAYEVSEKDAGDVSLVDTIFSNLAAPTQQQRRAIDKILSANNPYYTNENIVLGIHSRQDLSKTARNKDKTYFQNTYRVVNSRDVLTPAIQKQKQKVLMDGMAGIMSMVTAAKNLPEEQQAQVYDNIHNYIDEMNKEVIRINSSSVINRPTFNRLEKELANGKEALFNIDSRVLRFLGFTDNDIIIDEEY